MIANARYVHTNLIARDWRALAALYQKVFGCRPVPPERHYSGRDLERGSGVSGAIVDGIHLRLPGCGDEGPTLEIFSYSIGEEGARPEVNRTGLAHIAFAVPSVADARAYVLSNGGEAVGDVVTLETSTGARVTWCYVRDPEGNILELQAWD
jgi:catechol 2,3-dioxygenase-like lactoylglutathione lyase family enzyme